MSTYLLIYPFIYLYISIFFVYSPVLIYNYPYYFRQLFFFTSKLKYFLRVKKVICLHFNISTK